jgi:hypothetical protein
LLLLLFFFFSIHAGTNRLRYEPGNGSFHFWWKSLLFANLKCRRIVATPVLSKTHRIVATLMIKNASYVLLPPAWSKTHQKRVV